MAIHFACLALSIAISSVALAFVGQDPVVIQQSCSFAQVTAQLGPDGSIRYSVMGTCHGNPITGELAYATNHQMAERFIYQGAQFRTTATCAADPWVSGVACEGQQVAVKGADPGALINYPVPLSRYVMGAAQVFQQARANAARPKPPGTPVNARAETNFGQRATVYWLGPDQQGEFGPYLGFVVEARPKDAQGAAWTRLGEIARHPAPDYRLSVTLPAPMAGFDGWELRACATTTLATTCTGPFLPTIANLKRRIEPGLGRASTTPPAATEFNPAAVTPQAPLRVAPSAPNPRLSPPRSFGSGAIMRRDVPEGDAPAAEASPAEMSPGGTQPAEEKPTP